MAQPLTFLEEKYSLNVFKSLLNKHFETEEAIINLGKIPQWAAYLKSLNLDKTPLCDANTLLINGYFYNFTSPVPTKEELLQAFRIGEERNVDYYMVPTVRDSDDVSILKHFGFYKLPFHIESIFEIENEVDQDIRCRKGSNNFFKIKKYNRRAERSYSFNCYRQKDFQQNDAILIDAAKIHDCNAKKYNHSFNLYNYESLRYIADSKLKNNLLVVIRNEVVAESTSEGGIVSEEEKHFCPAIQTFINFIDMKYLHLYMMVQGKHDHLIGAGNNLYVATIYKILKLAESLGIKEIHLGRGFPKPKSKLGANKFNCLNNWIKPRNKTFLYYIKHMSCERKFTNSLPSNFLNNQ
jgi:hypothetical protein